MILSFKILAYIFRFSCRLACLLCWNTSAWLLGLQPGSAITSHFTTFFHQPNPFHIASRCKKSSRRMRKRRRPRVRTLQRKANRWLRRWLLPRLCKVLWRLMRRWCLKTMAAVMPLHACIQPTATVHAADRLQVPPLPTRRVRFAPCHVRFESSGFTELSQREMHQHVVSCLMTWCSGLSVPASRTRAWQTALVAAKPLSATRLLQADVLAAMLHTAAHIACLVESHAVSWEHIQSLGVVSRFLCSWVFPPTLRTKRSTSLATDVLLLACSSLRLTLLTAWQARGERRKHQRAIKRCLGLHPSVFGAFLDPIGWTQESKAAFTQFLSLQVHAALCIQPSNAVLYQLSSPYFNYVGSTKFDVQRHRCQGSSPVHRAYQHMLEHMHARSGQNTASRQHTRKCKLFRNVPLADHMFWVLEQGPEAYIRALEDASISCFQQHGNSKSIGSVHVQRARRSCASRRNRKRPRCRRPPANPVHAQAFRYDLWHRSRHICQAQCGLESQAQPLRQHRDLMFRVGFASGYTLGIQHMVLSGLGFGPVDIARVDMSAVLTRYIADSRFVCWDSLFQRVRVFCSAAIVADKDSWCAVFLASRVRAMPPGSAKIRATQRVSHLLVSLGLAPLKRICISWPQQIPLRIFHECVRHMKAQVRHKVKHVHSTWFASLLQPVRGKNCTFASKWKHIAVAKTFSASYATCALHKLKPSAAECRSMCRHKLHWKVPIWKSQSDQLRDTSRTICWLAHRMRCTPPLTVLGRMVSASGQEVAPSSQYEKYASKLANVTSGHVLVQEDKDKHAAWSMPIQLYEKWCFWMFRQDAVHWLPVSGTVVDICEDYRKLHVSLLPTHLQRFASRQRWRSFQLPYAYCTLKAKCFSTDAFTTRHVCQKVGHSCFRRIISWHSHPARHVYRGAGRAILGIITALSVGFETPNLFTAVKDFRAAVSGLRDTSCNCCRCQKPKPILSLCVCDAAQMYEELTPSKIREAVASLIQRLQQLMPNATGIVVARSRRLHTWLATNEFRKRTTSTVWTWSDILSVLDLALRQPVVRLGKALFRQAVGAPIGGQLSKAIASAVLAVAEMQACEDTARFKRTGFLPAEASSLHTSVANTRYVDDLAMASRVLCSDCLHHLTREIYAKPIAFDPAVREFLGFPWLDVWLDSIDGMLSVRADGVESEWRNAAGEGVPKKFRLKPWLGAAHADLRELRGIAAGKLVRLKSLRLEPDHLRCAVHAEICIWALNGYPAQTIRKVWCSLPHFPAASSIASRALSNWLESGLPAQILPCWFD